MRLGYLKSKPLYGQREGEAPEVGQFTLEVKVNKEHLRIAMDPKRVVLTTISQHLASACADTATIPAAWLFLTNEETARTFSLPPVFDFEVSNALLS